LRRIQYSAPGHLMGYVRITFRCYLVVVHGLYLPLLALGADAINGHPVSGVSGIGINVIDPPSGLSSENHPPSMTPGSPSALTSGRDFLVALGGAARLVFVSCSCEDLLPACTTKSDYSDKPRNT